MKVSLSWLNDYIPIDKESYSSIANSLTMVGLEVDSVTDRYDYLDSVVVGRILNIKAHPNAEKLKVCDVDIGSRVIRVVCGAPNIYEDMVAPVALQGTRFPEGYVLEKGRIRNELSEGMLCSEAELGLGTDRSGVMILDQKQLIGNKLAKALELSDMVFEIDLTPNRPDCLSIIGIAREIAALQQTRIKYPETSLSDSSDKISDLTSITIKAPDLCPRYSARLVFDINIAPSPFWLQDRLMSVGLRPINNIVDITNFVLMETGQPLHAFDFDRLSDHRIVVRQAKKGETFITLDKKEHLLTPDMLMICDGEKPVALAGIMGGHNSEVTESTNRVLIESAYFTPVGIRKTSKKLGISSESSHRFERGVDPEGIITALNRAAQLMSEIDGSSLIEGIIDKYSKISNAGPITLNVGHTNRLLGTGFDQGEIKNLLKSIEFNVEKTGNDELAVVPPSFRVDIARPVDLMEEIARLSGYNNIPTTYPLIPAKARHPEKQLGLRNRLKRIMTGFGFTETINYSFINRLSCDSLRLESADQRRNMVDILNPLTEEQAVMRTSLIPGLLETIHRNIAQQIKSLRLFEVGKIYIGREKDNLPEEIEMLAGIWTGSRTNASWYSKEIGCDFFDIKGVVEGLLNRVKIDHIKFTCMPDNSCTYTRPGHTAQILQQKNPIGLAGEIHPQVLRNFDLKQAAFIFELDLKAISDLIPETIRSKPIPKFPSISRDITIIIDKDLESSKLPETIRKSGEELIENLYLFDVFEGDTIPQNKKSISLRITYRSKHKTLEDDEVNYIHKNITDRLLKEFDALLPT
ncbi:MAG: phenylalanine--tRNA ligase subunit beta [Deltaproteobacteria bacterium]|jgi:phenylalanyl-tRNA synthetase beta chain|nr:phenylalanine--tRNA ligase subunit beta [Deltaproteobacteria bacterium]